MMADYPPNSRFFKEFYEKQAQEENHQQLIYEKGLGGSKWDLWWHQARMINIMKLLGSTDGSFLEVGCAEGLYVRFYSEIHDSTETVVGLDLASNYIKKAKERCPSALWVVGDVQNLPFRKGCFEIVLCTEVLEHLPNPRIGFHEICRVSRKLILVTVPGYHSLLFYIARDLRLSSLLGAKREKRRVWDPSSGHTFEIPMEELVMWTKDEGLHPIFLQERLYFNPLSFRFVTFFICFFKILHSILSKIPYLKKYGPANILLARHSSKILFGTSKNE
jgi:2-polyprenyl-3-methyl-5-hydroxy-6-metoxy-1,4-benzoquinol methylase